MLPVSDYIIFLKGPETQIPAETSLKNLMTEEKEKEGKDIRKVIQNHTDDEENPQLGHSEEDEGQMRRDLKEEMTSLQAGGKEGDKESKKRCDRDGTSGIRSVTSSGGEAQADRTHSAITGENHKPAKVKESNAEGAPVSVKQKTEDAPLNDEEKATYSTEQDQNKEGKTEKQKQRGNEKNVSMCYSFHIFSQ